jgi:hypothetical protein
MTAANDLAIRHALEGAGVEFIDENGSGPGVRLSNANGAGSASRFTVAINEASSAKLTRTAAARSIAYLKLRLC